MISLKNGDETDMYFWGIAILICGPLIHSFVFLLCTTFVHKLSIVQGVERWIVCTLLSVNVFVRLATQ
jgi:hypothetical protein